MEREEKDIRDKYHGWNTIWLKWKWTPLSKSPPTDRQKS